MKLRWAAGADGTVRAKTLMTWLTAVGALFCADSLAAQNGPTAVDCDTPESLAHYAETTDAALVEDIRLQATAAGAEDVEATVLEELRRLCDTQPAANAAGHFEFDPDRRGELPVHPVLHGIGFTETWCEADWDNQCDGTERIVAAEGWQICRLTYERSERGRTDVRLKPGAWVEDEPGRTNRFAQYTLELYAEGSRLFLDRWSSRVKLSDVRLFVIPMNATDAQRREANCAMPRKPNEGRVPVESPAGAPVQVTGFQQDGDVERYVLRIRNPNPNRVRVWFRVEVDDTFFGQWITKEEGYLTLSPNATWEKVYPDSDAIRWRHQVHE